MTMTSKLSLRRSRTARWKAQARRTLDRLRWRSGLGHSSPRPVHTASKAAKRGLKRLRRRASI
jgi:hypothetical protein